MVFLSVLIAAAASWGFGAIWYMRLGELWMKAAPVSKEHMERKDPVPFIVSFVCAIIVAGMMSHVLAMSGMTTLGGGLMVGFGIGLFLVVPWIATNYLFAGRDKNLIWIDGGYATGGCTIMGIVLGLML
ncbi:MAG: DUF1761 domain-containing protein [Pseudomonadota bacterium]